MSTKTLLRSFAGGEITPELAGRLDLSKFQTGLSLARNFITLPHGPAARRPGFEYVNEAGDYSRKVRLIPFSFSADQTAVLEFGHQYIRFHVDGATVLAPSVAISSIVGSTVTTSSNHGFTTGVFVFIGSQYHQITVTGLQTFTTADTWGSATTAAGTTAAAIYAVATPYTEDDLFDLHYTQSADVITIVHPGYAARELARLGTANWTLTSVSFAPALSPPTTPVLTVDASAGTTDGKLDSYVITAVAPDGISESLQSAIISGFNNLTKTGNSNTIGWTGVAGAYRYNVYKRRSGAFGYIGQITSKTGTTVNISTISRTSGDKTVTVTTATAHGMESGSFVIIASTGNAAFHGYWLATVTGSATFTYTSNGTTAQSATAGTVTTNALALVDDNILPDTTQTPPEDVIALNGGADAYPSTTTYHEQRRWFAGTNAKPQVLWATRTGTEKNLTSSFPTRDADGMELRIASSQYNQIRHLVALSDMIAFTAGGEFRIYSDSAPAITPTSVTIKPQGYSGASNTQPVLTSNAVLYVQAQGSRVRELAYNWESNAYRTVDVSIMAPHRFNGFTITDLAYSRAPDQLLWAVRNDGTLLGMTYVPDQQVYGWHAHDTDGLFESVCTVAEGNEDVLYTVVKRTINGRATRYIERLRTRIFTAAADAFFVDSGLIYDGTPTTTITGLRHLEGKTVNILTDGAVHPTKVVTNGAVTLNYSASTVHVGLPITADLRTLPLAIEGMQAAGQGTSKNVNKVHLRVAQSSVVKAGPDFTRLREYPARAVPDPYGSPPALRDGEMSLTVDPSWNQDAAICVRQDQPLPLTVLSMTLELQTGG